jgi:hypothetical protein
MKLGPGSSPVGKKGKLIAPKAIAPASLATLLHVVANELLGVVLEHFVDLVEKVVDLGFQTLAALGGSGGLLLLHDTLATLGRPALLLSFSHKTTLVQP